MANDNVMTTADDNTDFKSASLGGPWQLQQMPIEIGSSNSPAGTPTLSNMRLDPSGHADREAPCPCEGGFVYR
jgi:hypothetical protein